MSDVEFRKLAREMAGKQRSSSSILLLCIVTLIVLIISWAAITELDGVVRGNGKIVSAAQNQLVQSSEPGVILKRYVNEGDFVERGALLFDIDPIDTKTQLDQALQRKQTLQIKAIRLKAEINAEIPIFPENLLQLAPTAVATELALYRARADDLHTQVSIIKQRKLQKSNEVQEAQIKYETAKNNLILIRREIETITPLVRSGLAPETRLLTLQRDEEATQGTANSASSSQNRIKAGLVELDEQLKAAKQSYLTTALTDLSAIEGELVELDARIPALEDRVKRTTVRSPVDGVINRLNYVTADAYVNTGDILLEIVPTGSDLIVEAQIDPKNIAEIVEGQDVKISLTAFDATRYGRIDGSVINISADAINNPDTGAQYYVVDVSLNGMLYEDNGDPVKLLPGMVSSIDVLAGKRTVLDYIWQPIAKTKDKALRD